MAIGVSLREDAASGLGHVNAAINAASAGAGAASGAASAMRGDAASMRGQARLVNTEAGKIGMEADALKALVPQLDPYKAKLTNYGDELSALATSLQTRADDVFGQAGALTNLDPNATGLAGEYMKHYNLLSPDRYVSQGASDAQAAIQNQTGQMERDLARRGVSASSGAFASLRQQAAQKAAQLVAATKTLMRQKGLDAQAAFLDKMTGAAKTFFDMGNETESRALAAKGAAGDMAKGAAGIVTAQGDMMKDVGAMRAQVADLYAKGASIFGSAGELEGGAGNLTLNGYKALADAQNAAANYYGKVMSIASGGGGGGGGGGVSIAPAEDDDWMNWKGTGHSSTWIKNDDPDLWRALAAQGEK